MESQEPPTLDLKRVLLTAAPALVISVVAGGLCAAAAGPTLGTFLGGLAMAVLLSGPLVLAEEGFWQRAVVAAAIADGIALSWLPAVFEVPLRLMHWLGAYAVVAGLVAACWGLGSLLRRLRLPAALASAIVVLVGLAWLSWPVWLATVLRGQQYERLVEALVAANPLFALNGLLLSCFEPWATYSIAYRLTTLGDDVNYTLPRSILPCLGLHLALAGGLLALGRKKGHHRRPAQL
jgi:hypothetical protein